jgi:hypothetical protein
MLLTTLTLALLAAPGDIAPPALFAELSSPDQKARDTAAAQLRRTFKLSPREPWDKFLATLKEGDTKQSILDRLPIKMTEGGIGTGQSHMEMIRLDDRWVLRAWFHNEGDKFRSADIIEHMRHVWVAPPENFSGTWTTYFVNGQPSHVIEYENGKYHGTFTSNHANGSKSVVQHYGPLGCDGEDTGYYPSGKVSYRAFYRAGKPVGTWRWFNEQGEVTSTQEHEE